MDRKQKDPWDWPEKGVLVKVPPQSSKVNAYLHRKDVGEAPEVTNHFKLIRRIANVEILDEESNEPVGFFHPPMEMVVCFTAKDLADAGDKHLKFAAYINNRWWEIPTKHPPGECPHGNPEHVGAYTALITGKWDDPETGWGT